MRFGDLLVKLAMNARLSQGELNALRNFGIETQRKNSRVSGYTYTQGGLKYDNSFALLFSEKFEVDQVSFDVNIPQDYNHIIIITSGRTTYTGGLGTRIRGFIGATDYAFEDLNVDDTTIAAVYLTDTNGGGMIGFATGDNQGANLASSSISYIVNFRSPFKKNSLNFTTNNIDAGIRTSLMNTTWEYDENIERITIQTTFDELKKGSTISVYGVK